MNRTALTSISGVGFLLGGEVYILFTYIEVDFLAKFSQFVT